MKIKITNRQIINSNVEKTIEAILECEKWPEFIPTVEKIEFIKKEKNYALRKLHSRINGVLVEMVTETHYNPSKNEIEYNQIKTPWPLTSNKGKWKVKSLPNNKVELSITHIFSVKYSILGYLIGLLVIGPFFIYKHNKKDLKLYKKHIESNAYSNSASLRFNFVFSCALKFAIPRFNKA